MKAGKKIPTALLCFSTRFNCQKFRLAQCCLFQYENRTEAATNRLSTVITVQQELDHRLLLVNGDVVVPTCARSLE